MEGETIKDQEVAAEAITPAEALMTPVAEVMSVKELLKEASDAYKTHWKVFISITAIPAIVSIMTIIIGLAPFLVPFQVIGYIFSFILSFASAPALLYTMKDPTLPISDAYKAGFKMFFPYLWVSVLAGLVVLGGLALLFAPLFIFAIWVVFAPYIVFFEGGRGLAALTKSRAYVEGYFGKVLWRFFALYLMIFGLIIILMITLSLTGMSFSKETEKMVSDLFGNIFQIFLTPLLAGYGYALYKNFVRIKPELADKKVEKGKGLFIFSAILGIVVAIAITIITVVVIGLIAAEKEKGTIQPCTGMDCLEQPGFGANTYQGGPLDGSFPYTSGPSGQPTE